MAYLPLANILHHKLRSLLNALGIGIGICMLLTLSGLSRGSLGEIADRWDAVNAQLLVYPAGWGESTPTLSGVGLSDRFAQRIEQQNPGKVARAVPVFLWPMKVGGQDHLAAGVDPGQWDMLAGGKKLSGGRLFDPDMSFAHWLEKQLLEEASGDDLASITDADLASRGALELVIDSRLAKKASLKVGDDVHISNHNWKIVGVVPEGGLARVYLPRRTAQFLFGSGSITKSTVIFVDLVDDEGVEQASRDIRNDTRQEVVQVSQYRNMLQQKWGVMYTYVDAVNVVALIIAFLFIAVMLYTMVLQRTREIALLKSFGASSAFVIRQVLAESLLMTFAGCAIGIGVSYAAGWAIEQVTLYTVTIGPHWIAIAIAAAFAGAVISACYPAWRAMKIDMVEALTME
ncbi:MAG: FtsX-like permease family protein [Planctomycetes bacterium]|nr:FtsX-like permease family protein [Planctomycetota bacterium]